MAVKRLVFVLVIVAGLTLFGLQNMYPALSLVFLGMRSLSLPLSMWILMAIGAGILTSAIFSALFRWSQTSINPELGTRQGGGDAYERGGDAYERGGDAYERGRSYSSSAKASKPPVEPSGFSWGRGAESQQRSAQASQAARSAATDDDWEREVKPVNPSWEEDWTESGDSGARSEANPTQESVSQTVDQSQENEAWDWEEESTPSQEPQVPLPRDYEVEQQPKTQSWSGSIYSFGYRDGGETGVGKSESVYDAEYRIITPPPGSTYIQEERPQSQSDRENEDWIDEDEDTGKGGNF